MSAALALDHPTLTARLRQRLASMSNAGASASYALAMWTFVLDAWDRGGDHESAASGRGEKPGVLPYVPMDLEVAGVTWPDGGCLLDIGCLGGHGLYDVARRRLRAGRAVPVLVGIDIDEDCVAIGRRMAEDWAAGCSVRFERGDAARLPGADRSCDVVVARLLLPYARVREALAEIARVLRPGGVALFQTHGFAYYASQVCRTKGGCACRGYYFRPLLSGLWFAIALRQPRHRWLSEMAMESGTLSRACRRAGLTPLWIAPRSDKPLAAFRRNRN